MSSKSGNISFSLVNIVEAKVFAKNDTTGKAKKIKLIDNFSISTSYNIFADSMRWAPDNNADENIPFSIILTFWQTAAFHFMALTAQAGSIGTFLMTQDKKLMRLTQFYNKSRFQSERIA